MGSGGVQAKSFQFFRCLLVAGNCIVLLMSIGLIAIVSLSMHKLLKNSQMVTLEALLVPLGLTLIVPVLAICISLLGCGGAIRRSKWMLRTYSVVVGVLIVLFTLAFIVLLGARYSNILRHKLKVELREKDHPEAWKYMQQTFQCCGVDGAQDWTENGASIPASCFRGAKHTGTLFTVGCYARFTSFTSAAIGIIVALTIFLAISVCAVRGLVGAINADSENDKLLT